MTGFQDLDSVLAHDHFHLACLPPSRRCLLPSRADFFFWTRFENLAAKRRKINDRVVPILVAIRNWNDVIWLSRSDEVAEFAQCVAP